jgi:hypothetical protein
MGFLSKHTQENDLDDATAWLFSATKTLSTFAASENEECALSQPTFNVRIHIPHDQRNQKL